MVSRDNQLADPDYARKLKQVTIGLVSIFTLVLLYVISQGWGYFEPSLFHMILIFIVAMAGFYFAMIHERILFILLTFLIGLFSLIGMANSAAWRQDYINNGFSLEAYIETYPSYVSYFKEQLTGEPDVVGFGRDCVVFDRDEDQLIGEKEQPLLPQCQTLRAIQENYGVNVTSLMNDYFKKMKRTAQSIADGNAARIGYPGCINKKRCAFVPLPPADLSDDEILNAEDSDLVRIRDGFWDLVEKDFITSNVCLNMDLCRYLIDNGIMSMQQLIQLQQRELKRSR